MVVCLLSVQRYKFNYNIFLIILYFKMLVTAVQHLWVFVHYLCTGRLIKSDSLYKLLVLFSVIEMVNHFKVPIMMDFSIIDSYSMFQSLVSFQYFFCQLVSLAWMIPDFSTYILSGRSVYRFCLWQSYLKSARSFVSVLGFSNQFFSE